MSRTRRTFNPRLLPTTKTGVSSEIFDEVLRQARKELITYGYGTIRETQQFLDEELAKENPTLEMSTIVQTVHRVKLPPELLNRYYRKVKNFYGSEEI